MTKHVVWLSLVVVSACVADAATENEAVESSDDGQAAGAHDDATPELASFDEPALALNCHYVVICSRDAQDWRPVLVCDGPGWEPVDPWDPTDGDFPPFEPLEVDPGERVAVEGDAASFPDLPWPPPGCHVEYALVDTVHSVECVQRCNQAAAEDCQDLSSGESWSHIRTKRPPDFYDCQIVAWEPCGVDDCEPD